MGDYYMTHPDTCNKKYFIYELECELTSVLNFSRKGLVPGEGGLEQGTLDAT